MLQAMACAAPAVARYTPLRESAALVWYMLRGSAFAAMPPPSLAATRFAAARAASAFFEMMPRYAIPSSSSFHASFMPAYFPWPA